MTPGEVALTGGCVAVLVVIGVVVFLLPAAGGRADRAAVPGEVDHLLDRLDERAVPDLTDPRLWVDGQRVEHPGAGLGRVDLTLALPDTEAGTRIPVRFDADPPALVRYVSPEHLRVVDAYSDELLAELRALLAMPLCTPERPCPWHRPGPTCLEARCCASCPVNPRPETDQTATREDRS